jgi:hypothetical protein
MLCHLAASADHIDRSRLLTIRTTMQSHQTGRAAFI